MPPVTLREGNYKAREGERSQYTSTVVMKTSSLLLRTVISANQLSVYEAMADLCNELPKDLKAPEKLAAPDHLETTGIPAGPSADQTLTNVTATEKPGARIRAEIRTLVRRPEIIQTMFWRWFEACRNRTILLYS